MSLLRRPRATSGPSSPAVIEKIVGLKNELEELRPSRPPTMAPPPALSADQSERALSLLSDLTRQQIIAGQLDDARRTVGEALIALDDVKSELAMARGALVLAESLLALDQPQHAKPRLERALEIIDASSLDRRLAVRARIALGRTLVALDDISGLSVLDEARQDCVMLGEKAVVDQIDHELREAEKVFDTPRHVHTGYGRPVGTEFTG